VIARPDPKYCICLRLGPGILLSGGTKVVGSFFGTHCGKDIKGISLGIAGEVIAPGAPGLGGNLSFGGGIGLGLNGGPEGGAGFFLGFEGCLVSVSGCLNTPKECCDCDKEDRKK
jgi:hypothetical protein